MPSFTYNSDTRRYRDADSGRFVSPTRLIEARDLFADSQSAKAERLAARLASGDITVQEWLLRMRREVKQSYLVEYMLGRGGRHSMTQADYGRIGALLRNQYNYLQAFGEAVRTGQLSERQIAQRGGLYFSGAVQAYERGRSEAFGGLVLPAYPGDGRSASGAGTQCRANCRCHWTIKERDAEWRATWRLGGAEHCDGCLANAAAWSPYRAAKLQEGWAA
jgi:hypothetical protein